MLDIQPGLHVVLSETQGANVTRHVHSLRGIHAHKDASNNWEWPLQDGLGSVREVLDNSVALLESRNYDPFGNGFGITGTSQTSYGFTGELVDGGGLLDLRARRYAPGLGVFTKRDTFEGTLERLMSLNRYSWVEGNPVNLVDPSGLQAVETICGIMVASPFDLFYGDLLCLAIAGVAALGAVASGNAARQIQTFDTGSSGYFRPPSPDQRQEFIEHINAVLDVRDAQDTARKVAEICNNNGLCGGLSIPWLRMLMGTVLLAQEAAQAKVDAQADTAEKEKEEDDCWEVLYKPPPPYFVNESKLVKCLPPAAVTLANIRANFVPPELKAFDDIPFRNRAKVPIYDGFMRYDNVMPSGIGFREYTILPDVPSSPANVRGSHRIITAVPLDAKSSEYLPGLIWFTLHYRWFKQIIEYV